MGGGINRLKQYLAGARGNVRPCLKVFDDLRAEMLGLLESYQAEKSKNKRVQREIGRSCSSDFLEGNPSFEESSSFPNPTQDPYTIPREANVGVGGVGSSTSQFKKPRGSLESFFQPRTTPGAQPTIDAKWKVEKEVTWECIARWWYDAGIPFNVARSIYYQPMLDVVASCGSGFEGPSYEDIRVHFKKMKWKEYENTSQSSKTHGLKQGAQSCMMDGLMQEVAQFLTS